MDSLISVISELRQINSIIGRGKIELPQIVTVGSQSSGKSSVLEGIVGWDFLPRGTGIVTRRPLVLNLVYVPVNDLRRKQAAMSGDWATFLHLPNEIFIDFEKVRKEIEKDTIKVAGEDKDISKEPIHLTIYSDKVIDLSLVDLPGAIRFPLPNQSATIKQDIESIIDDYLRSPKSLILAVTPANQDIANSDALFYAKKYDPEGKRTLCVLTKIDIMDKGTNAYELLTGKKIPVKLGVIGVLNRSQEEINNNKSIAECSDDEEIFFHHYYPTIAAKNGRKYLTTQLNKLLINHIAENLPELRDAIDNMAIQENATLDSLGEAPAEDETSKLTLNKAIRKFCELFTAVLEGNEKNLQVYKETSGAKINLAFREFSSYKSIRPEDGLTQDVLVTALRNSHGTNVPLFIPEHAFNELANRQIKRLKEPSIQFVDIIKNLLLETVDYCTNKEMEEEKNRFPRLYKRINKVACDTVNQRLQPTKIFVEKIVDMHLNYRNIRHPEFDFDKVLEDLNQGLANSQSTKNWEANPFESEDDDDEGSPIPTPPIPPARYGSIPKILGKDKNGNYKQQQQQQVSLPPDEAELRQCLKLKSYVIQYYEIVRNSLQYMLPKAIMMELVNFSKENLPEELEKHISALDGVAKELMKESESITQAREKTIEKIKNLETSKARLQNLTEVDL